MLDLFLLKPQENEESRSGTPSGQPSASSPPTTQAQQQTSSRHSTHPTHPVSAPSSYASPSASTPTTSSTYQGSYTASSPGAASHSSPQQQQQNVHQYTAMRHLTPFSGQSSNPAQRSNVYKRPGEEGTPPRTPGSGS